MENFKELREEFLNTIEKDSTKRTFTLIFKKVRPFENELGKSIEEMNEDELKDLLFEVLVGKTVESTNVKLATMRKYLKYAGNNEILKLTKNDVKDAVERFNSNKENIDTRYVSKNDLYKALNRIENDIDRAIAVLLMNGIYGHKLNELQNLKMCDLDFVNNKIKLPNRTIKISEKDMEIIKEGIEQKEYTKVLKSDLSNPTVETYPLNMESEYVIKTRIKCTTNEGLDPYRFSGIANRLFRVVNMLCIDDITSLDIVLSYAVDKLIEYGKEIGNTQLTADEMTDYTTNVLKIKLASRNLYDVYYSIIPKEER